MSAIYNERTEPSGWRQAKIWKLLLAHLDRFSVRFDGPCVFVTANGGDHVFSHDIEEVRVYVRKHWGPKTPCLRGEANPRSKLTGEKVAEIRVRCAAGESQLTIAKDMGVSNRTISDIACGLTWRPA